MSEKSVDLRNSYLTFKIGGEIFAAHVNNVIKILEMAAVTKIPQTPAFIKGIINLSGGVLPVVDARVKLGFEETEYDKNTCIVVLELRSKGDAENIGIIVDAAMEVMEISDEEIKPPPVLGKKNEVDYISGIIQQKDVFIILLDIQKIFSSEDILNISKLAEK